jgi:hypothetical protein
MYISVMFKDKNKVFKGKSYDFKLATSETPKVGSIIRMYNADFTKVVCNATRVKVMAVKKLLMPRQMSQFLTLKLPLTIKNLTFL